MHLDFEGQPTKSINILDVEVPEKLKQIIPTGIPQVDEMFGVGITPSAVGLFVGGAGVGKTSLALTIANSLTKIGHIALYNSGEESVYQVRKTVDRLGLRDGFFFSGHTDVVKLIEECDRVRAKHPEKHFLLFVDSLQCLEFPREEGKRGRALGPQNMAVACLEYITTWCKKNFTCAFILGHVNKAGKFEGKNTVKHAIDYMLLFETEKDKDSLCYGKRMMKMDKNRFGPSHMTQYYSLEESGVEWIEDMGATDNSYDDDEESDDE